MENNIGATDRRVRIALGGLLAVLGIVIVAGVGSFEPLVGALALVVGLVLVATGLVSMCPIYRLVGVDTSGN